MNRVNCIENIYLNIKFLLFFSRFILLDFNLFSCHLSLFYVFSFEISSAKRILSFRLIAFIVSLLKEAY